MRKRYAYNLKTNIMKTITKLPNRMNPYKSYLILKPSTGARGYLEYCEDMGYCLKVSSSFHNEFKNELLVNSENCVWSSTKAIAVKRAKKLGFNIS